MNRHVCRRGWIWINSISRRVGSKLFPVRTAPPDGTTFAQITLGDKMDGEIPAFGYWNLQFYHPRAAYVRFNYDFPRGASIAVYGRRNALPTHTQYEILELLNGFTSRQTRSTHVSFRLYIYINIRRVRFKDEFNDINYIIKAYVCIYEISFYSRRPLLLWFAVSYVSTTYCLTKPNFILVFNCPFYYFSTEENASFVYFPQFV